jgi:hypothetical protein
VLEGLARKNVTGVVEIDGNPDGAIYLDKRDITFARASWSPDLVARLYGVLEPTADVRELLDSEDRPDRDLGTMLLRRGYLTVSQLQAILRSVVVDAVTVLTVPLTGDCVLAGIRFESARTHWAQSFCRLPVQLAQAEAAGQAERMVGAGPDVGLVRAGRTGPGRTGPGRAGPGLPPPWRHGDSQFATLPAASLKRVLEGLRRLS